MLDYLRLLLFYKSCRNKTLFLNLKDWRWSHYWSDKDLKNIVVNPAFPSLNGGSLEIKTSREFRDWKEVKDGRLWNHMISKLFYCQLVPNSFSIKGNP